MTDVPCKAVCFFNPWGPKPLVQDWSNPGGQQFLLGKDKLPGRLTDQPNPRGPVPAVALKTHIHTGLTLVTPVDTTNLPSTAQFFNPWGPQYPVALRTWFQSVNRMNTGLKPLKQDSWPNPVISQPNLELRTWFQAVNRIIPAERPAKQIDWPNPVISRPNLELRTWLQLTSALLKAPVIAPTYQNDWPNPTGPTFPIELRTWALGYTVYRVTLSPDIDHLPCSAQWLNPWGPAYPTELRTFLQGTSFRTPFVATVILNQKEWPNPTLARRGPPIDWIWSVDLSFATPPFNQYDWPVPTGPLPTDLRTFINPGGQRYVVGQDKLPFRQNEWPVSIGPLHPLVLRTLTSGPNQYAPLFQTDWPNPPRGAQPASDLRTFINQGGQRYLISQDVLPPRQLDWPVPKGPLYPLDLRTWLQRFVNSPEPKGYGPTEWPNPRGPEYPVDLRTWLQFGPGGGASLLPPFYLTDWPVPRGPLFPIELRTFINQGGQRYLLGKDQLPYNQYDWVNPRGAAYPQDLRSWWNAGLPPLPFAQLDWPVPKGPAYAISLRTWLASPLAKPNPPPTNYDWPVPRGPIYPINLRTLIGLPQLLAPPPGDTTHLPCTAMEWFNPWAPKRSVDLLFGSGSSVPLANFASRAPLFWRYTPRSSYVAVNALDWVRNFPPPVPAPSDTTHLPSTAVEWFNPWGAKPSVSLLTIAQEPTKFVNRLPRPATFYRYVPVNPRVALNAQFWVVRDFFLLPPVPPDTTNLPSTAQFFNPWGPRRLHLDWSRQNIILQQQVAPPPPTNYDWPNPQGATPATTLKTWLDQTRIQLIGQDQLPIRLLDQPNPRGAQQPVVDLVNNGFGIQFTPPMAPFSQPDWPNPRGALRQNPDWISSVTVVTLQAFPPFAQLDWPNPRGSVYNVQVLSQASTILFQVPMAPFSQQDWPVPNGYVPALENKTFINQGGQRYLANQDKINARQSDWPVPAGYIPANSLKTFINNGGQLLLAGQDKFFGLAGNPNFDWPVPKGQRQNDIYNFDNPVYIANIPPGPPPVQDTFHFLPFLATMGPISAR